MLRVGKPISDKLLQFIWFFFLFDILLFDMEIMQLPSVDVKVKKETVLTHYECHSYTFFYSAPYIYISAFLGTDSIDGGFWVNKRSVY